MKKIIPLLLCICLAIFSFGQKKINGQWHGFFNDIDNSISLLQGNTEYVLELEITGDKVVGTSYTYFNNHHYFVICNLNGVYFSSLKKIVVNETERIKGSTPPDWIDCLQTHILYYQKQEGKEVLTGQWKTSPYNAKNGGCGYGNTTLSRRVLSNPFVIKKRIEPKKNNQQFRDLNKKIAPPVAKNKTNSTKPKSLIKPIAPSVAKAKPSIIKPSTQSIAKNKTNSTKPKSLIKPIAPSVAKAKPQAKSSTPPVAKNKIITPNKKPNTIVQLETKIPSPTVAKSDEKLKLNNNLKFDHRAANVLKTIEIEKDSFTVNLYDNGEIDGDSVSLFYNGKLILQHQRLSDKAITVTLNVNNKNEFNELEMYAENLGTIPPNTALMVVIDSGKRYEVFITSDLEKSGIIRFIHKSKTLP